MRNVKKLVLVLIAAFSLRVVVASIFPHGATFDLESYRIVGEALLNGENIYRSHPSRYPYFPGWMLIEGAGVWAANASPLPFWLIIRLPPIVADVSICVIIYQILQHELGDSDVRPLSGAAIHAANPVAIAVVAGHGQFDSLPILGLILAIYLFRQQRFKLSSLALGTGIVLKPIPAFMGLLFLSDRESTPGRVWYFSLAAVPTAILSLPFILSAPKPFIQSTVGYESGSAVSWFAAVDIIGEGVRLVGLSPPVIPQPPALTISKYLLVVLVLAFSYWYSKSDEVFNLWEGSLAIILLFYVIPAGVAVQYLYWAMPFLLLVRFPFWYRALQIGSSFSAISLWYFITYGLPDDASHSVMGYGAYAAIALAISIFWLSSMTGLYLLANRGLANDVPAE